MKCQICGEHEANVHFKQVVNGTAQELFICEQCASRNGFDVHSPMSMTDFLFGMAPTEAGQRKADEKDCPVCRMRQSDYRKLSRLGCPACYESFSSELEPQLKAMQCSMRHVGKVPVRERITAEVATLQTALESAVKRQDFEEAAELRDTINDLKKRSSLLERGPGVLQDDN